MKHKKNIKYQKSNIKNPPQISKIFTLFLFVLVSLFLISNLLSSQVISPLYSSLINEDKKATVEFLQKIKNLPQFPQELKQYKKIHGEEIEEEVFAKERQRKQMIKKLEQILKKNPKARDVLYSLYLLYEEDGNKIKAGEYLRRAKEVDPIIK